MIDRLTKYRDIDNQAEYDALSDSDTYFVDIRKHYEKMFFEQRYKPLTFTVKQDFAAARGYDLASATRLKRVWTGATVTPERELVGADFADYGDRILLAQLGYFSCDLKAHRAKREREALIKRYIEEAYDVAGLDRDQQHNLIAARMEATKTDGVWAKSTGEYAIACRRLDDFMLRASPAIAQSIKELGE